MIQKNDNTIIKHLLIISTIKVRFERPKKI